MTLSIITPNRDNIEGLERTFGSLICQTAQCFEWIIVDCGSTNGSIERAKQFDNRFLQIISASGKGMFHAINEGIEAATGEYLLILHPGDCLCDESIIGAFAEQKAKEDIVSGNVIFDDSIYNVCFSPEEQEVNYRFMLEHTIPLQSSFIRKDLILKYGGFDESLKFVSDWKFFFVCLIQFSCSYRKWERCITSVDTGESFKDSRWTALRDLERESVKTELLPYVYRTYLDLDKEVTRLKESFQLSRREKTERAIMRMVRKISSFACANYLNMRSIITQKRTRVDTEERIIVSLTSWRKRIDNVPIVLQSILHNTVKPDIVVLNLSAEEFPNKEQDLPESLLDYVRQRTIEIIWTPGNLKAFKKFIPTMKKYPSDVIIAIDDDFIYPKDFIESFVNKHRQYPNSPISGNPFLVNGVQGHCGCASLVKADYYGKYVDELLDEHVLELRMDDIFYVFCAALNGVHYQYVGKLFYTNMRPIQGFDGLSDKGRDKANEAMGQYMVRTIKERYHIDMTKIHKPFFSL